MKSNYILLLLAAVALLLVQVSAVEVDSEATPQTVRSTVSINKLSSAIQTYGHGAVMGASLEFANDAKWQGILKQVQPAVAAQVATMRNSIYAAANEVDRANAIGQLILYLENSPVLSAYAATQHLKACTGNENSAPSACSKPLRAEWDLWTSPANPSSVALAKIAHGAKWTLIAQNILKSAAVGFGRPEVVSAPTALEWLEYFGRAVNLNSGKADIAGAAGAQLASSFFKAPSGIVLDIKSTYASPAEIDSFVTAVKSQYGINIFGVGSFIRAQIDSLKTATPVHFYHTHYALLNEATSGVMRKGDYVMFNGGSLLVEGGSPANPSYSLDAVAFKALSETQSALNLRVAIYAQEPALSAAAANALVNIVNENAATFTDGFAYGHLNGRADSFVKGNGLGGQAPMLTLEKATWTAKKVVGSVGQWIRGLFSSSKPATVAVAAAAPPANALQPAPANAKVRTVKRKLKL